MKFKEIEFKFDASDISMVDFSNCIEKLNPHKHIIVSSHDDYFTDSNNNFIRYRHNNNSQELTIKRKLSDHNNNERIEVNLSIIPQDKRTINAFVDLLGYKHNFSIYKVCKIYWIDNVVLCYYIVYNENMIELNRFIEIEADEECEFKNEEEAFSVIKHYEDLLRSLGINSRKRLKRSLFEMYNLN
jgi:predicted adenylyl cyclase CyaB